MPLTLKKLVAFFIRSWGYIKKLIPLGGVRFIKGV